ncbi:MAG: ISL3 family transposase [Nocardioidaceae bacterium]|nr:ISL3 family transposase [Nocardioidaceae bacterium]
MRDDAIATTAMLGLSGFWVLAVSEHDGEVEQAVEMTAEQGWCPSCGVQAKLHNRRPSWVRDLPSAGRPVRLVWVKRVWRCGEPRCPRVTWTETSEQIRPRASWTERARREACRRVGQDGHTVTAVAADMGVGWATIMAAVREYGAPLVDDPDRLEGVHALGVDETAFLAATPTAGTVFATGIVALNGRPRLLDIVQGRSGSALSGWVLARDDDWRTGIEVAALDPFRGYATALRSTLPDVTRVLDAFHVVRLGFDAVDQVRRRVQHDTLGHRGRKGDPLFGIRRLLRRGHDHHTERSWERMLAGLDAGDHDRQVARAWIAAQDLRLLYRATTRQQAERRLLAWFNAVADHEIPELTRLARTLDSWRAELLAYFDTGGVSNGPTEAMNGLIKKVKRIGHGFRNFANYRLRLLLHCGVDWQTQPTTPIRGRLPRLAA